MGDNFTFTASPKDQYGDAFTASVTWSSSNTTVGTVDASGKFIAFNPGTAMVNASNGSFIGTANVLVDAISDLIKNPGFELGTNHWVFYTNGIGSFSTGPPSNEGINASILKLVTTGSNMQLYQSGIQLESKTIYRLRFWAKSNREHDLSIYLHKHDSPYTDYGLSNNVDLGKDWKEFMIEFTTKGFTGQVNDARLRFWFPRYAAAGDIYYIDDVRLERVRGTSPPTIITQPVSQTVIEGQTAVFFVNAVDSSPLSYQWQRNGIDISGAIDLSYTTPPTTLNDSGSKFSVKVTNSVGSVMSNIVTLTVKPDISNNIIQNPGFEYGNNPWVFYTNGIGSFSTGPPGKEGNNASILNILTTGSNIQLYQSGLQLEPMTRYRLSFAAKSNKEHDLSVYLHKHGSPYTDYGLSYNADLGNDWKQFVVEFTTKGFSGQVNDARLRFWFSGYAGAGDIYNIDDVRLEKMLS